MYMQLRGINCYNCNYNFDVFGWYAKLQKLQGPTIYVLFMNAVLVLEAVLVWSEGLLPSFW